MLCTEPAPAFNELTNVLLPDQQPKTDRLQLSFDSEASQYHNPRGCVCATG